MVKDQHMPRPGRSRAKRLGQRLGIGVFAALVGIPTLIWTRQIMLAVFPEPGEPAPSCSAGLRELLQGVESARKAALDERGGERASLERFRTSLAPAWKKRPGLAAACGTSEKAAERLRAVDALRYAEEHAVRYEATALASQRQRARDLERELSHEPE
jgi:hypothetical protein